MPGFQAIILVCLASVPPAACNEETASEIHSQHVANELGCLTGWQDVIARSAQAADMDDGQTYVRTLCRRSEPEPGE